MYVKNLIRHTLLAIAVLLAHAVCPMLVNASANTTTQVQFGQACEGLKLGASLEMVVTGASEELAVTIVLRNESDEEYVTVETESPLLEYDINLRDSKGEEAPLTVEGARWKVNKGRQTVLRCVGKHLQAGDEYRRSFPLDHIYDCDPDQVYTLTVTRQEQSKADPKTWNRLESAPVQLDTRNDPTRNGLLAIRAASRSASRKPMVAVREFAEKASIKLGWNSRERKVVAQKGAIKVAMWAGDDIAIVNKHKVRLSQAPKMNKGSICAPEDILRLCAGA